MSHAKLSPSASARWLRCLGSPAVIEAANLPPDESSEYADDGTASHMLGAWALEHGTDCAALIGQQIDVLNEDGSTRRSYVVDDERASYVQVYVDRVRDSLHDGAQLLVEKRVDSGIESQVYGKIDGTGDAIVLAPLFNLIEVHDLKYGKGNRVDALTPLSNPQDAVGPVILDVNTGAFWEVNPQLAIYGLGALNDYGLLGSFETARLIIHQPRLDHLSVVEISVADLLAWAEEVRQKIELIDLGMGQLKPSDTACKWCPVKSTCSALSEYTSKSVLDEFADLQDLTEDGIAQAYERVPLIRQWLEAIESAARALCERGDLPGYVMEVGRKGNRTWKDEKIVEQLFKERYRMKRDDMYNQKLISPTDAEKKFKANPKQWEDLQEHITRGAPSMKIVKASEAKNPVEAQSVAQEFGAVA